MIHLTIQTRKPLRIVATCLFAIALGACAATPVGAPASVATASAPTPAPASAATAIPFASAPTQTVVFCGTLVLENPGANGTYMLVSPTSVRIVVFRTVSSRDIPEFGTYACARFNSGSARAVGGLSLTEFVSFVSPGEPGYTPRP